MCLSTFFTAIYNSTSSLIIPTKQTTAPKEIQQSLAESTKFASTEGRFTIIDKRRKESTSFDSESDLSDSDSTTESGSSESLNKNQVKICKKKKISPIQISKTMSVSTSRFKIVPVDSHYKRGRWTCWDYYDSDIAQNLKEPRMELHPTSSKIDNIASSKSMKCLIAKGVPSPNDMPLTAPPNNSQTPSFLFDFPEDADKYQNSESTQSTNSPAQSAENFKPSIMLAGDQYKNDREMNTDEMSTLNLSRITPSELLHNYGLERSLSVTYNDASIFGFFPLHDCLGKDDDSKIQNESSTSACDSSETSKIVAIDSKIEQAMDLVKTHLMFAVREEVEVLRAKIIELEATILQLEAENSILKEHIPADILSKLNLQNPIVSSTTTTVQ